MKSSIPFIILISTGILLLLGADYLQQEITITQRSVINKSGRLRMLSQKIIYTHKLLNRAKNSDFKQKLKRLQTQFQADLNFVKEHSQIKNSVYSREDINQFLIDLNNIQRCRSHRCQSQINLNPDRILKVLELGVTQLNIKFNNESAFLTKLKLISVGIILTIILGFYIIYFLPKEKETVESENFLKELVNQLPVGMVVLNNKKRIIQTNDQLLNTFGFNENELIENPMNKLLSESTQIKFPELLKGFNSSINKRVFGTEFQLSGNTKNGVSIDIDIAISPLGDKVLCLIKDVTVENKLKRENSINSQMSSIGTMTAGIAHELNNPLSVLKMSLRLLDKQVGENKQIKKSMNSVERIFELVENINNYSKSCSSTAKIDHVSLTNICTRSKILTRSETKNLCEVNINKNTETDIILANEGKITQILINLIVNASHAFTKDNYKENNIDISIDSDVEKVILKVKDNGHGIPSDVKSRIFETFFTTKDKTKGTGLGLSLVKEIIDSYGGSINVDSQVNSGTTFTISFPKPLNS